MSVLFFLLWIILNGKITLEIVLFGIAFSALFTLFSVKVLGYRINTGLMFFRNFLLIIRYLFVLILEIIKAAFSVISVALSPSRKPDPVVIEFHSGFKTDFQNVLLANSITLTPGTYTLFQEGDRFVVHCLIKEYAEGMEESSFVKTLRKLKLEES